MLAFETEDVLQAWALPMENIIGVGGFVLALATNPLTSVEAARSTVRGIPSTLDSSQSSLTFADRSSSITAT